MNLAGDSQLYFSTPASRLPTLAPPDLLTNDVRIGTALATISGLRPSFEKALIVKALAHTGGRRIEASQLLGLGRNTLTRKIQELKIDEEK